MVDKRQLLALLGVFCLVPPGVQAQDSNEDRPCQQAELKGAIEGRVLTMAGVSASGWEVFVCPEGERALGCVVVEDGRFRYEGLQPGPYLVLLERAHRFGGGIRLGPKSSSSAVVVVEAGRTTVHDIDLSEAARLEGQVRIGEHVPHRAMMLSGSELGPCLTSVDDEGRFSFIVPPGEYRLRPYKRSCTETDGLRIGTTVKLEPGMNTLRFVVPAGRVRLDCRGCLGTAGLLHVRLAWQSDTGVSYSGTERVRAERPAIGGLPTGNYEVAVSRQPRTDSLVEEMKALSNLKPYLETEIVVLDGKETRIPCRYVGGAHGRSFPDGGILVLPSRARLLNHSPRYGGVGVHFVPAPRDVALAGLSLATRGMLLGVRGTEPFESVDFVAGP